MPALLYTPGPAKGRCLGKTLSFADRVSYQRAIEEVYWRHRVGPNQANGTKLLFDDVMPKEQIERKVEDYLRSSHALDEYWHQPITAEQLQSEMERMAQHTRRPDVLRELFEALGSDPFIIAECLVRPVLAAGRLQSLQNSGDVNAEAIHVNHVQETDQALFASYVLPRISKTLHTEGTCTDDNWTATSTTNAPQARNSQAAVWTGSEMIVWGGIAPPYLQSGGKYDPSTDSWMDITSVNAPTARAQMSVIWTGTEMIIWGGLTGSLSNVFLNTGGNTILLRTVGHPPVLATRQRHGLATPPFGLAVK